MQGTGNPHLHRASIAAHHDCFSTCTWPRAPNGLSNEHLVFGPSYLGSLLFAGHGGSGMWRGSRDWDRHLKRCARGSQPASRPSTVVRRHASTTPSHVRSSTPPPAHSPILWANPPPPAPSSHWTRAAGHRRPRPRRTPRRPAHAHAGPTRRSPRPCLGALRTAFGGVSGHPHSPRRPTSTGCPRTSVP